MGKSPTLLPRDSLRCKPVGCREVVQRERASLQREPGNAGSRRVHPPSTLGLVAINPKFALAVEQSGCWRYVAVRAHSDE